jgi:hypothetical protein
MAVIMDESKKLISHPESLPEQGGVFWFAGGVPERSLPKPCVACLDFLASLNEEELQQLIRRARTRTVGMRDEASRDTT